MGTKYTVPAIDLADFVLRTLNAPTEVALLKVDIEGAEYTVLPRLLTAGVLCRVSHLIVEWHLAQASEAERLACLSLKLSLSLMLERGCASPPQVLHEEFRAMNAEVQVPGLLEEAMVHAPPGNYTKHVKMGRWKTNYTLSVSKRRFRHGGVTEVHWDRTRAVVE